MNEPSLLLVCLVSAAAVFGLLALLAALMQLLRLIFPHRPEAGGNEAVLAAITSAVSAVYPGMRVTRVEEKS
jgi:hypothetical protein